MGKLFSKIGSVVLILSSVFISSELMAGDAAAGKAKSGACMGCHGATGKSNIPTYPNLAGQNKMYLVNAMKAYKLKQRNGGMAVVMQSQVANLSDTEIENLAEYYSSL